jgi:shikimate kinase
VIGREDSFHEGQANPALTDMTARDSTSMQAEYRKDIPPLTRSVVLVGLMGAGKSKIGKALSALLNVPFIDVDEVVETIAGMPITSIFELYGEEKFREIEAREIAKLVRDQPAVISTGGGAFINDETRTIINKNTLSVWLKATPETLVSRISNTASRPLLRDKDPVAVLKALANERNPYYQEAHLTIDTDGLSLKDALVKVTAVMIETLRSDSNPQNNKNAWKNR